MNKESKKLRKIKASLKLPSIYPSSSGYTIILSTGTEGGESHGNEFGFVSLLIADYVD